MKGFLTAIVVAAVPSVAALEQFDQAYSGNSGPARVTRTGWWHD